MNVKWSISVLVSVLLLMSFGIPDNLEKKVDKEIKNVFEIASYKYEPLKLNKELNSTLPTKITSNNFFKINSKGNTVGYVYVDKAPSKTAQFDYLVIFDKNLKIAQTKVLIYREEYGGEIGSKRWLSQFIGKTKNDSLDDVAAISGATISVRSMKNAVSDILNTVEILHDKKIL